ncbi:MAG: Peptide deformylase, partial [Marinimicrobia bacterium 46_47]
YIYGAPVLRKKTAPVEKVTEAIRRLTQDMTLTMYDDDGIGLSANQVGESHAIFILGASAFEDDRGDSVFLNPEILEMSEETELQEEGCLSIPGIRENVPRSLTIRLRWQDLDLKIHEEIFTGFPARVIQHEYDHLNGIFFTDRISSVRKMFIKSKLSELASSQS